MKDIQQAIDKPMVDTASRDERIRNVAYRKFLARGELAGDAETDWLEAESEINAEDSGR